MAHGNQCNKNPMDVFHITWPLNGEIFSVEMNFDPSMFRLKAAIFATAMWNKGDNSVF